MRPWFVKRKYPEKVIDNEMKKVRLFPPNLQNKKREIGVPFVPTYHTIPNSLSKIIRESMYLLNMNEEVTETLSPGPMVSFCQLHLMIKQMEKIRKREKDIECEH